MADSTSTEDPGAGPERTEDGRWIVVDGRRWRASDPGIPEKLRAELVSELMSARRAVRDDRDDEQAVRRARGRVQDAKVALGERGEAWWEPTDEGRRARLAAVMRTLLRHRDADATICPSDAARIVGGEDWRPLMPMARAVAVTLSGPGVLEIRQKGAAVTPAAGDLTGASLRGPVRVARGPEFPTGRA